MLTAAHIRYATGKQLAALFAVSEQAASEWTQGHRSISGLVLKRVARMGIPKAVAIEGLDLRLRDAQSARRLRTEIDQLLSAREAA